LQLQTLLQNDHIVIFFSVLGSGHTVVTFAVLNFINNKMLLQKEEKMSEAIKKQKKLLTAVKTT